MIFYKTNFKIDTIIHFAADCTSTRCYSQPGEAYENNVFSYIKFLETVYDYGKVQKFVHISTDEVCFLTFYLIIK